jgi:hypothetical protein
VEIESRQSLSGTRYCVPAQQPADGEIYTRTSGTMTGAIPLRGISLATSERMSLDNQYSYAPVIRGVARTNARLLCASVMR